MLFVYIIVEVGFSWFITPLGELHVTDEPSYPLRNSATLFYALTACMFSGGTINVAGQNSLKADDLPMEYLLAHFGTKVRRRHVLGTNYNVSVIFAASLTVLPAWGSCGGYGLSVSMH
jgi:hypothetical protein